VLQRTPALRAQRRLWGHDYFEARLEEECAKGSGPFALVRLRVENGAQQQLAAAEAISRVLQGADTSPPTERGELEVLLSNVTEPQAQDRADALVAASSRSACLSAPESPAFPRDGRDATGCCRGRAPRCSSPSPPRSAPRCAPSSPRPRCGGCTR